MTGDGLLDVVDSAEHRMIRDTVREFCEEEIKPIAQEVESEHRFPQEVFDELAELDMMGVPVSEEYGGLGGDQLMYALVTEELGRVSGGIGLSYAAHTALGAKPIDLFGTDETEDVEEADDDPDTDRIVEKVTNEEYYGETAGGATATAQASTAADTDLAAEVSDLRDEIERQRADLDRQRELIEQLI